jgi:hypothetical protein
MRERPVPSLVVGASEDEPLVLAGPPGELTGQILLHNPGDAKVVLRDAGIKDPSGVLRLPSARHPLDPVVLRPDQGDNVPLSISVDPYTPPGDYQVELEVGGRSRAAVLHVHEVFDLTVQPRTLVVVNQTGLAQQKRLTISNDGNVSFTIADPGTVELHDDMPRDRDVLRVAIEPLLDRDKPDLEALVVALLAAAREDGERFGSLAVRTRGGTIEIQPGETKPIDLEITVVDELPSNRRYHGHLPILTRDVDVIVVASGGPVQEEPPPRPARKTTAASKRAATTKPNKARRRGGSPS